MFVLGKPTNTLIYIATVFWPDQLIFDKIRENGYQTVLLGVYIYGGFHLRVAKCSENSLSPNVADLQHFDIELFVASLFATLFAQELTLLQLV